jgi:uncharacterized protein (DUF433 family)
LTSGKYRSWAQGEKRTSFSRERQATLGAGLTTVTRITRDPSVTGGKPCIRGMRVTVRTVVGHVATGRTRDEILREYPYFFVLDGASAYIAA